MDTDKPDNAGTSRRRLLKCMAWAGTGIIWTVSGGVPRGLGLGKQFFERFAPKLKTGGWYSFDQGGVHFVGLVNVLTFETAKAGGFGTEQLEWLEKDLKGRTASTPIVVFTHVPMWPIYPEWGWA